MEGKKGESELGVERKGETAESCSSAQKKENFSQHLAQTQFSDGSNYKGGYHFGPPKGSNYGATQNTSEKTQPSIPLTCYECGKVGQKFYEYRLRT